jgi:hypothetical protein
VNGIFDLARGHPIAFELFIDWLYSNNKQVQNFRSTGATDNESWRLYAAETYIVADGFIATDFSKFALGKVVSECSGFICSFRRKYSFLIG